MGWLSRINIAPSEYLHADQLNSLALDIRNWGGDVNGGGNRLANVILDGSGGFQYYISPMQLTPGANGASFTQYDAPAIAPNPPAARWVIGKDNGAETGGNAGSDFQIQRYDDAGNYISSPIVISRKTGLIGMGAQQWNGNVDGNNMTLSNVNITGYPKDPTTAKGDLIVRDASVLTRLPVSVTDGWGLIADSTQAKGMKWAAVVSSVYGRSGAVVAQAGDYTVAQVTGAVPSTRQIIAGTGLTGTGDLSADRTLSVAPNTTNQQVTVSRDGTPVGTRKEINFITGANVVLGVSDVGGSDRVDVTISSTGGGSGGGSQTPWLTDIDANGKMLFSAGRILINQASTNSILLFSAHLATNSNIGLYQSGSAGAISCHNDAVSANVPLQIRGIPVTFPVGNVGINGGISDPAPVAPLHVFGKRANDGWTVFIDPNSIGTGAAPGIAMGLQNNNAAIQSFGAVQPLLINPSGGSIGIGVTALTHIYAGFTIMELRGTTQGGLIHLGTAAPDADNTQVGQFTWIDKNCAAASKEVVQLMAALSGTTANNRGGYLALCTKPDGGTIGPIERMRIAATGRVGVGTTNPATYKFEVSVTGNDGIIISNPGNAATDYCVLNLYQGGASRAAVYSNNNRLCMETAGSNVITLNQYGGNVMVGFQTDQGWRFAVNGGTLLYGGLLQLTNDNVGYFRVSCYSGLTRVNSVGSTSGGELALQRESGWVTDIGFYDGNANYVMFVQGSTRRVGIGTTTPGGPLHVVPKGSIFGTSAGSAVNPAATDACVMFCYLNANNWNGVGTDVSGNLWIRTGLSGNPNPQFFMAAGGQVNIACPTGINTSMVTNNMMTFWVNEGSNLLMFGVKYSNGTWKQGQISLT